MKTFAIFVLLIISPSVLAQNPSQPAAPATAPSGASPSPAASVDAGKPESSDAVDALPRKYIELWNTGNPDLAKQLVPFVMISHGHRSVVNALMLNRVVSSWRRSMPDLNLKIEDTIVQGEKVAMSITLTGTYTARLFPNTVNPALTTPNRNVRTTEILMFQLKDGKIRQIWEEYDALSLQLQMGGQWRSNQEVDASVAPHTPKPASEPEPAAGPAKH